MGQIVGKLQHCSGSVADVLSGRRKRKRPIDSQSETSEQSQNDTPKKKKLLTTTQYIYQALFLEQKNSDIAVNALSKVWHLHKVYLSQSPYFYTMFNGSWKEATQKYINIKIIDQRITIESLDAVFGSMYSDEIEIDSKAVISVLATATLFHLDGIIEKCSEVMIDTINAETAIQYYEAACEYGVMNVKRSIFKWFQINLLSLYQKKQNFLRHISIELMTSLTGSPDLYVMQTEFSLYTLLKTWMFLRLHPNYDPEDPDEILRSKKSQLRMHEAGIPMEYNSSAEISQWSYFANRVEELPFLATPEGQPFVRTFQKLRTQYLTNHYMDLKLVYNDNIIPKEWLYRHIYSHWNALLKIDHNHGDGIQAHSPDNVDNENFFQNAMRCGRLLLDPGYQKWRWTGFNFGVDLILIMDANRLIIRRHHRNEHERMLTLQTKRQFMIRATVTSVNAQRQPIYTQSTDIRTLTLEKNEETELMVLSENLLHPLMISVNMLVIPPANLSYKDIFPISEDYGMNSSINGNVAAIPISEIGAGCCERPLTPESPDDSAVYTGGESSSSSSLSPLSPLSQSRRRSNIWSSSSPAAPSSISTEPSSLSPSISNYSADNAAAEQQ